jgi:hypothetical protein
LTELHAEAGEIFAQFRKFGLVVGPEFRAGAHEIEMDAFEHPHFFRVEAERLPPREQTVDSIEQLGIEINFVPMPRKNRRQFAFDVLQFIVRVGAGEIREYTLHSHEQLPAALERCNRAVEGGRCPRNGRNFGPVLGQRSRIGLAEMFRPDAVEWRCAVRRRPIFKQRIDGHAFLLSGKRLFWTLPVRWGAHR